MEKSLYIGRSPPWDRSPRGDRIILVPLQILPSVKDGWRSLQSSNRATMCATLAGQDPTRAREDERHCPDDRSTQVTCIIFVTLLWITRLGRSACRSLSGSRRHFRAVQKGDVAAAGLGFPLPLEIGTPLEDRSSLCSGHGKDQVERELIRLPDGALPGRPYGWVGFLAIRGPNTSENGISETSSCAAFAITME